MLAELQRVRALEAEERARADAVRESGLAFDALLAGRGRAILRHLDAAAAYTRAAMRWRTLATECQETLATWPTGAPVTGQRANRASRREPAHSVALTRAKRALTRGQIWGTGS